VKPFGIYRDMVIFLGMKCKVILFDVDGVLVEEKYKKMKFFVSMMILM